ncbi:hypothetical protein HK098_006635 [Nowakowskiella sp. JEL0407]|nr:hypothetical protein HK098_006635 [Nowakowskiella sp. JEL0407]
MRRILFHSVLANGSLVACTHGLLVSPNTKFFLHTSSFTAFEITEKYIICSDDSKNLYVLENPYTSANPKYPITISKRTHDNPITSLLVIPTPTSEIEILVGDSFGTLTSYSLHSRNWRIQISPSKNGTQPITIIDYNSSPTNQQQSTPTPHKKLKTKDSLIDSQSNQNTLFITNQTENLYIIKKSSISSEIQFPARILTAAIGSFSDPSNHQLIVSASDYNLYILDMGTLQYALFMEFDYIVTRILPTPHKTDRGLQAMILTGEFKGFAVISGTEITDFVETENWVTFTSMRVNDSVQDSEEEKKRKREGGEGSADLLVSFDYRTPVGVSEVATLYEDREESGLEFYKVSSLMKVEKVEAYKSETPVSMDISEEGNEKIEVLIGERENNEHPNASD